MKSNLNILRIGVCMLAVVVFMLSLNPDAMAQNRSGNLQLSGTPINETSPEPAS